MASEAPIGVIFDCDGTLLDSMGVWREMESEFAHRAGGELSPTDKDRLTTMTTPEAVLPREVRAGRVPSRGRAHGG